MRNVVMDQRAIDDCADVSQSGAMVQVRIRNLDKTFYRNHDSVQVLRDISLDISQGELLVLLGPSGCGKTTLLRCLVGLEKPGHGLVELNGRPVVDVDNKVFVQPNRRDVAMVFQNYALWPHMKVAQNVAYPLKARKMRDEIKKGRVEEVLQTVQCDHLADRYPPELSGGQQQRISLARALAPRPALLLLDEPLSNLDALLRIELRAQLRRLHRELGFTGVYVTHDQEEALALGTRVAVMKEGKIEQIGKPNDVYKRPSTEYVADFLGARNRLKMVAGDSAEATIENNLFKNMVRPGVLGEYHLRWRDGDLFIRLSGAEEKSSHRWILGAELSEVLPAGDHAEHVVKIGNTTLFIDVPASDSDLRPGDRVDIGFDLARTLCYDSAGSLLEDFALAD
ncbi:ABC transporter ATP-binding protein [Rhodococcus opacus]|uniref:ABC transporter ATP-binding protein n=1 Tax=Rhodococcus opacus TaxID=37919 RepID=UPI00146E607B|nr:ABC transporter ATP-binding protein [Rhodococcus opacus]MDV7090802.1 ABC transporter ATP-binding protein [Rhodococcus opacus]WKN60205.1 ABC transporter ATP-binding protein [Rhodococcus opacus]